MRLPENRKFRNRTDRGKFFEAKFMYFFHAAAGIPFRVSSTFGLSRSVSDNPQTMSGLSGALMAPLHRHYKTARTETRRHLLLKIRQMPTQTSASRGYVFVRHKGGIYAICCLVPIRDTHKSPKIVCWLADTVRGVFQTWKDTDHRRWQARHG